MGCRSCRQSLTFAYDGSCADPFITPEIFASHLCEDLRLPHHPFFKEVIGQIKRHIEEAQMSEQFAAHLGDQLLAVREDNRQWLESGAHKRKKLWPTLNEDGDDPMDADEEGEGGDEILKVQDFLPQVGLNEELRVMIKVRLRSTSAAELRLTLPSSARHYARQRSARRQVRVGPQ